MSRFRAIDCRLKLAFLTHCRTKCHAHASSIGSVPQWFWHNHLAPRVLEKRGYPRSPEAQAREFENQNKKLVIRAWSPPINRNAQHSYHSHVSKGIGSHGLRNGPLYGYSSIIIIVEINRNIAALNSPMVHLNSGKIMRNMFFASSFPILLSGKRQH